MIRFLHLADVHLDTAFEGRSAALRDHLRGALRTAFQRAVDCAIDEAVHAVLIAGDLFDDDRLSVATEAFLVEQVERLVAADIELVYATGNHDPGGSSFRAAAIDWPDGVHYVDSRSPTSIELTAPDGTPQATVVAAGHVASQEAENLAASFPEAGEGLHVGLLHAHVTSADQIDAHDRYAPCRVADLRSTGYDYWALGHVHTRQVVDESIPAWYPGNLQGRTPRETGARGGLLVELHPDRSPNVSFRSFAPTRWEHLQLNELDEVNTVRSLVGEFRDAFQHHTRGAEASDWLLRVDLEGPCPLAEELAVRDQIEELETVAAEQLNVRDVEVRTRRLTPPVDLDSFRDEKHLAGEVLRVLQAARADEAVLDAVAPDVLAGLTDDDPDARQEYLHALLDGLDREAVARLVTEDGRTR